LHSSARNHATRFSMFFISSKKEKNILSIFFVVNVLRERPTSWAQGVNLHLPCRKCSTNHWHNIKHWGGGFTFHICCRHKVKKDKNFKNPAAEQCSSPQDLSGLKLALDRTC
jgi:hypothetical protein